MVRYRGERIAYDASGAGGDCGSGGEGLLCIEDEKGLLYMITDV